MTYLEKYRLEKPHVDPHEVIINTCPHHAMPEFTFEDVTPEYCFDNNKGRYERCEKCWSREIPGTEPINTEKESKTMNKKALINELDKKDLEMSQLMNDIAGLKEQIEKASKYEGMAKEVWDTMDALMQAGFTREEAFTLTRDMVANACKKPSLF